MSWLSRLRGMWRQDKLGADLDEEFRSKPKRRCQWQVIAAIVPPHTDLVIKEAAAS